MVKIITNRSFYDYNIKIPSKEKVFCKIKNLFIQKHSKKEVNDRNMTASEIHHLLDDLTLSSNKHFNKLLRKHGGKIINPHYLLSQIHLIKDKHSRNSALNKFVEFELKILGHEMDIGGEITIKNKKSRSFLKMIEQKIFGQNARKVTLTGYERTKAHGKVADAMESFLSGKDPLILEALNKSVRYDEKSAKQILEDIKNGKAVTIPTGWEGHAVEVTICNGYLCYSNSGESSEGFEKGIHVYQINPDKIDLKFINKLLQISSHHPNIYTTFLRKAEAKERMKWFENDMVKELEGSHFRTIAKQPQWIGNCTFVSAKCGAEALELVLDLNEPGLTVSEIYSRFEKAEKNAQEFEFFVRKEQFSFFLNLLNEIQNSDRKGKILSEKDEFRIISEMCLKFYNVEFNNEKGMEYIDEILKDKFSLNNYDIENCVVDLHRLPKKVCDQYVHDLLEFALPGAFIIYKDRDKNVHIDGKNLDGSLFHSNLESLSELPLKFPVASELLLNWEKSHSAK